METKRYIESLLPSYAQKNATFQVITKFALKFNVDAMLEEIKVWIEKSLKVMENFGMVLKTIKKLGKLGFSVQRKIDFYQIILNFANDASKEALRLLLISELQEFGEIILHSLLKAENNNLDVLLGVLAQNMKSAEQARLSLDLLEKMVDSDQAEILCVFWREVVGLFNVIFDTYPDAESFRQAHICQNYIQSSRDKVTPTRISLELLRRTRCWRKFTQEDLLLLRQNPQVECWHFAEMVLDWISSSDTVTQGESYNQVLRSTQELRDSALTVLESKFEQAGLEAGLGDYRFCIQEAFDSIYSPMRGLPFWMENMRLTTFSWRPGYWCAKAMSLFLIFRTLEPLVIPPYQPDMMSREYYVQVIANIIKILFLAGSIWLFCHAQLIANSVTINTKHILCFALRRKELSLLAMNNSLTLYPYFGSIFRLFPFSNKADIKLMNVNGVAKFDFKMRRENRACHTYMVKYSSYFSKSSFISVFTQTHSEIMEIMTQQSREDPAQNRSNIVILWTFIELVRYYIFGDRRLDIRALSS